LITKQVRDAHENMQDLLWERMLAIRKNEYLANLPSGVLYELASEMGRVYLKPSDTFVLRGEGPESKIGILMSGEASLRIDGRGITDLFDSALAGVLPMMVTGRNVVTLSARTETHLLVTDLSTFEELMFDNEELALSIYRWTNELEKLITAVEKEMVS
jgi:hypothetical protein